MVVAGGGACDPRREVSGRTGAGTVCFPYTDLMISEVKGARRIGFDLINKQNQFCSQHGGSAREFHPFVNRSGVGDGVIDSIVTAEGEALSSGGSLGSFVHDQGVV